MIVAGALLLGLALAGGASRADEDQQAMVRLAAVLAIGASLWPLDFEPLRRHWRMVAAVAAVYLLLLIQLLPLPPELWAAAPGRAAYAAIAQAAGAVGWRPLSLSPDRTLNAVLALLPATAAALAALYLDGRGRLRLAQGVVVVACLSGLFGLAQLTIGDGWRPYRETSLDSAVGLFANRNHQAVLMACALPLTGMIAGVRLREGQDRRLVISAVLGVVGVLLVSLVATGSRMGLALGPVGLLGAGWAFRAARPPFGATSRRSLGAMAGGAVLLLAAVAVMAWRSGALERLASGDVVNDTRGAMVEPLLATASAFMPVGAGFGTFESAYRQFEPTALLSTIYMNQAHDELLQLVIEGGVGALVLLAGFLSWWVIASRAATHSAQPARRRAMGVAAFAIIGILMLSSLVDYPLRTPLLGAVFAFACVELAAAEPSAARRARTVGSRERLKA